MVPAGEGEGKSTGYLWGKLTVPQRACPLPGLGKIRISFRLSMARCKKCPLIPQASSQHTLISTLPPPDLWTHKDLRFGGFKSSSTQFTYPETFSFPEGWTGDFSSLSPQVRESFVTILIINSWTKSTQTQHMRATGG